MTLRLDGTPSPRLYAEAFDTDVGEAAATLSAFIEAGALPLLLFEGDALVSQGLGIELNVEGRRMLYLYALATDTAARNRGFLRTLLKETAAVFAARGYAALCLLPANAALADAYRRMGFSETAPAGAQPLPETPEDFSLYAEELPTFTPTDDLDFLHGAIGGAMSRAMLSATVATLADVVYPARLADEAALLSRRHPGCALAVSSGLMPLFRRRPTAELLLMPLSGKAATPPEPLPR